MFLRLLQYVAPRAAAKVPWLTPTYNASNTGRQAARNSTFAGPINGLPASICDYATALSSACKSTLLIHKPFPRRWVFRKQALINAGIDEILDSTCRTRWDWRHASSTIDVDWVLQVTQGLRREVNRRAPSPDIDEVLATSKQLRGNWYQTNTDLVEAFEKFVELWQRATWLLTFADHAMVVIAAGMVHIRALEEQGIKLPVAVTRMDSCTPGIGFTRCSSREPISTRVNIRLLERGREDLVITSLNIPPFPDNHVAELEWEHRNMEANPVFQEILVDIPLGNTFFAEEDFRTEMWGYYQRTGQFPRLKNAKTNKFWNDKAEKTFWKEKAGPLIAELEAGGQSHIDDLAPAWLVELEIARGEREDLFIPSSGAWSDDEDGDDSDWELASLSDQEEDCEQGEKITGEELAITEESCASDRKDDCGCGQENHGEQEGGATHGGYCSDSSHEGTSSSDQSDREQSPQSEPTSDGSSGLDHTLSERARLLRPRGKPSATIIMP
ncbi:hypothetical protein EJ04DRAFT_552056 [Polyplosphaeria fusca]|uniref:Uncharacterized protein n=1 Tax=Polyplosphaeria fusca TaxID=682080 RepID=A0A9P4QZE3_9PLEO|nr:hypothetical protein EJ04DRAFT_552056 [Polyplosphaeria fusca]